MWGAVIPPDAPVAWSNERGIELPLAKAVLQLQTAGRVLDAGCALNGHLDETMQASVFHLTQNIVSEVAYAHKERPLSYVSLDLRDLSVFGGAAFDRTVCVSTLEHVGLDNTTYYGPVESCPDTMFRAVRELCRVTRTAVFLSVPYHDPPMHCPQWRFLGPPDIKRMTWLISQFGFAVETRYYAKADGGGWYGGTETPLVGTLEQFPDSVNAICCVRGQQ